MEEGIPVPAASALTEPADTAQCWLESLLPDLRHLLLSILDLPSLKSLVCASPVFHEQYVIARRTLLCQCLDNTLGVVAADAWAAYLSGEPNPLPSTTRIGDWDPSPTAAVDFLKSYEERRCSSRYSLLREQLTVEEAVGISEFHLRIVLPLAGKFMTQALANLWDLVHPCANAQLLREQLSLTEEMRLLRALYRFQIGCNLFGNGRRHLGDSFGHTTPETLNPTQLSYEFFHQFQPWEYEEIACIYAFALTKYQCTIVDIPRSFRPSRRFKNQREPTPPPPGYGIDPDCESIHAHAHALSPLFRWFSDFVYSLTLGDRTNILEGMVQCGLRTLHSLFFDVPDHSCLISFIRDNVIWRVVLNFIPRVLYMEYYFLQSCADPSDRRLKQQRLEPMPFPGDIVGLHPPLAWTLLWKETYSNTYGLYIISNDLRSWGYVIWDAARIEGTPVRRVLYRYWNAGDPRYPRPGHDDIEAQI
jgi:hypothetical protein